MMRLMNALMIDAPVTGDPDRVAFVSDGRTWSFSDLDTAAARIAADLIARPPALLGERIGLFVRPGFHWIASLTGIWRAGGVAVPLALSHPPPELDFAIRDSGATLVLVDDDAVAMMTPIATAAGAAVVGVSELLNGRAPVVTRRDRVAEGDADRPATLVYTSGTTGRPKAVVTTHGMLDAQVASLVEAWEWTSADRTLLVLPLHHVHGIVNVVLSARAAGAVCEFLPRFDAAATWARLESGEITVFSVVPTIYHRLIAMWDEAPADVRQRWSAGAAKARLMMCGSAALPVSTLERWRTITGHTLLERYGMTELGMALSNPLHGDRRPGSVGQPLPRVHVRIVDEAGVEVDEDVTGDLEVSGPTVFREYLASARGDPRRVSRRLVSHGRRRRPRARSVSAARPPQHRHHQDGRSQDLGTRNRRGAAPASRRRRLRRRRPARRRVGRTRVRGRRVAAVGRALAG